MDGSLNPQSTSTISARRVVLCCFYLKNLFVSFLFFFKKRLTFSTLTLEYLRCLGAFAVLIHLRALSVTNVCIREEKFVEGSLSHITFFFDRMSICMLKPLLQSIDPAS